MNECQAIDFATGHGIVVTTPRKTKHAETFRVGEFELIRGRGRKWLVVGQQYGGRIGEVIEFCVRKSLTA